MTDTPPGGGPQLPPRWGAALGNIADAAVRAETLAMPSTRRSGSTRRRWRPRRPRAAQAERVNVSDLVMVAVWRDRE